MDLTKLAKEHHEQMKKAGFYDEPPDFWKQIALLHSEVSEALQADRRGNGFPDIDEFERSNVNATPHVWKLLYSREIKDILPQELAGIILRAFDIAASKGIDIHKFVMAEMKFNKLRQHKHGKKY